MKLPPLVAAAALSACAWTAGVASAQVTGKVIIDGEAPIPAEVSMASDPKCAAAHSKPVLDESIVVGKKNALANVVVNIKAPEGKELKGDLPKEPVVIDQKGCQYFPHVVGMMVGQGLVFKNSDAFLHNVHSLAFDNKQFNVSQPNVDKKGIDRGADVKAAERFAVKCDIHPWMLVHVNAFTHPFFAVSNEKGEYSVPTKGLADGKYEIEIWQEKLLSEAPMTQEIEVKGGKATVPDIKIPATAASAAANGAKDVKLASAANKECTSCSKGLSKAQAIVAAAQSK